MSACFAHHAKEHGSRKSRVCRLATMLAAVLFIFALPGTAQADEIGRWPSIEDIHAKAWIVMDCQTGEILLENQADLPVYPASTTKIMTAILALESGDLDRVVEVSPDAVDLPAGSSKVGYLAGEQVNLKDVMYGMMLASGNDAANIVAEGIAGSREDFVEKMNVKAAVLGLTGSHFMNPSGLQNPAHVVTARDMAKLAAYAMKNQQFRNLVCTRYYSLPPTNLHPFYGWAIFGNTNRLLLFGDTFLKSDYLTGIIGVKTGSTNDAGNNLIAAATSISGHELISALMGVSSSPDSNIYVYSRTLLEKAAQAILPQTTTAPTTTAATTTAASETSGATTAATSGETSQTSAQVTVTPPPTSPTSGSNDPAQQTIASLQGELLAWRSLSLALLLVLAALLAIIWLFFYRMRQRRAKMRPKRIR